MSEQNLFDIRYMPVCYSNVALSFKTKYKECQLLNSGLDEQTK